MTTQIDWHEELEAAVPHGPGHLDPAAVLVQGHRALRRRRTTIGAGAMAAVLTIGGVSWAASTGDVSDPTRGSQIATQSPPSPPAPTETTAPEVKQEREPVDFLGNPAALTFDGELVLAPRTARVLERMENPMGYAAAQGYSLAIRAIYRGREQYSLMVAHTDDTGGSTSTSTVEATGDFVGWVESAKASQHTLDVANGVVASPEALPPSSWLKLGPGGRMMPGDPRVEIRTMRQDVDLDGYTGAVGVLEVAGTTHFVVVREAGDGSLDVIPGGSGFADLQAFIDHVRRQNASGAGLR